jgi:ferredoxin-NADP reductase
VVKRSYSVASSPREGSATFELVVKLIPSGVASAYVAGLVPGDELTFLGPLGFFTVDAAHPGDVVFAATGSGLTPVLPMLEEMLSRAGEPGTVHVFHGCRFEEDLFFQDRLAVLAAAHPRLRVHAYLTRPPAAGWSGGTGRICDPVMALAPALASPVVYLVGNGAMIKELKARLQAAGFDRKKQLRSEIFHPA